jgi:signal peptidase I
MKRTKSNKRFIITLLILIISLFLPFIVFKEYLYVITTPSMTPALGVGDLVIRGYKSPENIHVGETNGDILILRGPQYYYQNGNDPLLWNFLNNNTPIIHRAIDKKRIGDLWYFLTKGDNNELPDGALNLLNNSEDYLLIEFNSSNSIYIPETEILGIVFMKIPFIGYLNIYNHIIIIGLIGFLILYLIIKSMNYQIKIEKKSLKSHE